MDGPINVLHVDDDGDFADLTATFLERSKGQITVETALHPDKALTYISEETPGIDCIVSDYDMPGMNGIEFLKKIRANYPELPFILFTGKGSEQVAAEAVEADVSGYLQKEGTDTFELLANRVRSEVNDYRRTTKYREYKTVVDSLTDPVYVLDNNGKFRTVNDAFVEFTGYDRDTIIGSPPSLVTDQKAIQRAEEELATIFSEDGAEDMLIELEVQTADGRTVPVENHMGLIPFTGDEFQGSVGVLREFSTARQNERFRRQLYSVLSAPGLAFDEKCRQMLELGCQRLNIAEGKLIRIDTNANHHETVLAARDTDQEGRVADLSQTYCRRVVESGDSIAIDDSEGEGWKDDPAFEKYGHACYIGVEVIVDGDRYGTVCFFDSEPHSDGFTDAERVFVELIGKGIEQELHQKQTQDEFQKRETVLTQIHDIVSKHEQSHTDRIERLVHLAREYLGADYGAVSHITGNRYEIEVVDDPAQDVREGDTLSLSQTACEQTIA